MAFPIQTDKPGSSRLGPILQKPKDTTDFSTHKEYLVPQGTTPPDKEAGY